MNRAALPSPPILAGRRLPSVLLDRAHAAAAVLAGRGAGPGSRIAVGPARPVDVTAWLLGADLLGAATLVLADAWTPRERDAVLADAAPHVHVDGRPPVDDDPAAVAPLRGGDPLFYLATTSGSSGRPKVLARSRRSWRIGFDALGPVGDPVLIPGPLASSLFLFGTLHALHHGSGVRWRRRLTAADAADAGAVHLVPAMLAALLTELERRPRPVRLRTVVCGGGHVGPDLWERCARLLPDTQLVEYYGSAEHSLIALRRGDGPLRPVPGVQVRVVGGELRIRTPQAFAGYLRGGRLEPAGNGSPGNGSPGNGSPGNGSPGNEFPGDGFLGNGDRGEIGPDGGIVVHGRGSATISSGGALVAAEEVENVLRAVPGVTDVVVAGTPHPTLGALVTAVLEAGDRPPPSDVLRAAARDGLAPGKRPRRWLVVRALPRLASGKPARAAVAAALADGTLDATPVPGTAPAGDAYPARGPTASSSPDSPVISNQVRSGATNSPVIDNQVRSGATSGPTSPVIDNQVRSGATSSPTSPVISNQVRSGAVSGPGPDTSADHGRGTGTPGTDRHAGAPVISSPVPVRATGGPLPDRLADHRRGTGTPLPAQTADTR